jgi:hypothetical protein
MLSFPSEKTSPKHGSFPQICNGEMDDAQAILAVFASTRSELPKGLMIPAITVQRILMDACKRDMFLNRIRFNSAIIVT